MLATQHAPDFRKGTNFSQLLHLKVSVRGLRTWAHLLGMLLIQWRTNVYPCEGRGSLAAPAHRDESDVGREQCVIALAEGAFDVWPGSHKTPLKTSAGGHYHLGALVHEYLTTNYEKVVFACSPGDVLIFKGGYFFHGSPAIGGNNPSPRVMTYATFWPPSTAKGLLHSRGRCKRPLCAALGGPFVTSRPGHRPDPEREGHALLEEDAE